MRKFEFKVVTNRVTPDKWRSLKFEQINTL